MSVTTVAYDAYLDRARRIAVDLLAPQAEAVDLASALPVENIRALASAGLLGLAVPAEYGGIGAPGRVIRDFQGILASACGVTTFVVFQHFGLCGQLARSENHALRADLLPRLARGERFGTIAFSHLRRPGPPAVRVTEDADGFLFNGVAPWATGWGMADELLLAGTLPGGRSVWVIAPAVESDHLRASPPMHLCAAGSSATVSLTLRDFRVPGARWVKTITAQQLAADTYVGMLSHSVMSLGVARASAALLRTRGEVRRQPPLVDAAAALVSEAYSAREELERWAERTDAPHFPTQVIRIRAWCIDLGVRAALAAVITSGGGANSLDHPAQRLYREAMLYSVTALTGDLQAAALQRLAERRSASAQG